MIDETRFRRDLLVSTKEILRCCSINTVDNIKPLK
jgi:hypothetical protein